MNSMGPPPLKSAERPPLITPSASPPPSRFTYRNPDSDGPSPTKRQRLFSTPRLTLPESSTSSSASRPQSPVDVQKEREASKLRLLDVWAGIAERYKVPVEDDDLVNIRTGKITKDNGFLRRQETLHFGMIAAPISGSDDEGSEEEEEDEYDVDELDAFADEDPNLGDDEDTSPQIVLKPPANTNPFVSIMKVAEEEDLRQFMKAEQERKALCGSDVEEDEDDECSSEEYAASVKPDGETESDLEASAEPDFDEENGCEQEMEAVGEHEQEGPEEQVEEEQTEVDLAGTMAQPIPLYLDSEDELDNWNEDESSIVYPVVKSEPPEDHISVDEEDEVAGHPDIITEVAAVVKSSDKVTKPMKSLSRPKSIKNSHQLYTPPQSHSSYRSSAAPIIEVIDLSSSSESSPPPSASISQKSLKGQSKPNNSNIPVAFQRKPFQKTKPHPTTPKESTTATLKLSAKTSKTTSRPKPYVLLPPRNASSSRKVRSDLPSPKAAIQKDRLLLEDDSSEPPNSSPSKPSKGKGKAKAVESETTGAQPRKPDKTRHVSSGPSSDVRRVSTRSQNATRSIDEGESVSTQKSSRSKTRSGVQDHKTLSSSKTSSKDAKLRTKKSDVASDDESASTHRKRKRTSLDSTSSSPMHDFDSEKRRSNSHKIDHSTKHASTSRVTLDEERKGGKAMKGSSSRRRQTSSSSDSDTGLAEDSSASESDGQFRRNRQQPQVRQSLPPALHPYHHMPYPPSHYPPQDYPPIPDPRAQLIITHAMHQLSALVGGSWGPPPHYGDGAVPYTPTHRHRDGRASAGPFLTPTHHPHPYPYAYDPNYSNATLPPDSSEVESSPHKQSSSRRKSIVKRSQSRGRRVSFRVDEEERGREVEGRSSPTAKEKGRSRGSNSRKSKPKGRENVQERHEESSDGAELDYDSDGASEGYVRGRTPGPGRSRKKTPSK